MKVMESSAMQAAPAPAHPSPAVRLCWDDGNFTPSSSGFSVEALGEVSVLLKIKFHLVPVVQEPGQGLRGPQHWQQPPEQVEALGIPQRTVQQ